MSCFYYIVIFLKSKMNGVNYYKKEALFLRFFILLQFQNFAQFVVRFVVDIEVDDVVAKGLIPQAKINAHNPICLVFHRGIFA